MVEGSEREGNDEGAKRFSAPAISLPKGGGAIRGVGEKFAANPVTGTGSMTVPIATSPGRSGFGPELAVMDPNGNRTDATQWLPAYAATLARETHMSDPLPAHGLRIQIGFSYSDGLGREIQKKIQAEPGPAVEGGPVVSPRWVGSGWTIFNNKGKPVREYEPFFSKRERTDGTLFSDHRFEFGVKVGVSPILFYDPVERVVATLHPNHTWEKVVFGPWRQESWDVNDTVTGEPQDVEDVNGFFVHPDPDASPRLPAADYLPTWYALRIDPAHAAAASEQWPDSRTRQAETLAAQKAAVHAETPTVAHADVLGRTFLTVAHNKLRYSNTPAADPPAEDSYETRVIYDIEGNEREVIDAKHRVVVRYHYDMLGNRIHQASMEADERRTLNDIAGNPDPSVGQPRPHFAHRVRSAPTADRVVRGRRSRQPERRAPDRANRLRRAARRVRRTRGAVHLHLDQAGLLALETQNEEVRRPGQRTPEIITLS